MKTLKYKNYTVRKLDSGTIEATKDGHIASPTKPLLREIAQELGIGIENVNGDPYNTRQLGILLMRTIEVNQSYKTESNISFMDAIKKAIRNSPLTPQEIREEIKKNYPYLYGTESHHKNVDKGHYQDIPHAVLAQIYSQTKDNRDFFIDKSTKPLTIGLSQKINSSNIGVEKLIENFKLRYHYGVFYLDREKKIEKALNENNVPNQYGVYVIYSVKDGQEELIYIGKSGTMISDGTFKNQGIRNRLKAVGEKNIPRSIYFQNVIQKYELDKLKFVWIVTFDDTNEEIPAYIEAKLLQTYYDNNKKLPILNKGI